MPAPNVFAGHVSGDILPAADWNNNWALTETSLLDVGPYVISGLVPSAGAGLSVAVTLGHAFIGADINFAAGFNITALTDNTTNHLFVTQAGAGTSNTTGTPPAMSAKIGTCVTAAGIVTSVDITRASGRQQFVQPQNLVHGGGGSGLAGNPRSVDLSQWNATQGNGFEVFGVLPAGALPADVDTFAGLTDVTLTTPAQGDVYYRNAAGKVVNLPPGTAGFVLATGGPAANPSWVAASSGTLAGLGDVTLTGVAQGDIFYRGATRWNNLAAGTSGQFLKTQGAGANPIWASLPADTDTFAALTDVVLTGSAQGDIYYRNAAGNVVNLGPGTAGFVLSTGGAGANPSWVAASSGTLAGLGDVTLAAVAQGDVLYRGATRWNNLAAGTAGQVLTTQGAGANPTWTTPSAGVTVPLVLTRAAGAPPADPRYFVITAAADTLLPAGTEQIDVNWNLAATRQFATGALTTQEAVLITAPTYAFVGASTITNAATVHIVGAPTAGTNATITNGAALWVQGQVCFGSLITGASKASTTLAPGQSNLTPTCLALVAGAGTALTAGTEAVDVSFGLARTVQFATGALALQRAFLITPPTYSFVAASTITDAITVAIAGAPVAGTNATITNPTALRILTGSDAGIGLTIQGNSGTQSGDYLRIRNSAGGTLLNVNAAGQVGINSVAVDPNNLYVLCSPTAVGTHGINVQVLNSDANNYNTSGLFFQSFAEHSTGQLPTIYGAWGYAINLTTSVTNPATLVCNAVYGLSRQIGSGVLDQGIGLQANCTHDASSGAVNHWIGVYSSASIGASVTVGDLTHFYAHGMAKGAGAVLPVQYVLYADVLTAATTNYGVYILGPSTLNFLEGSLGIGQATPTARLHLPAGVATASGAPLKFTSGPLLTTPEAGAIGFLSPTFYLTPVTTRRAFAMSSDTVTADVTVANTITETLLYTGTIAANEMAVGKMFRALLEGRYSGLGTDSFTLRFKMGGATFLTVISTAAVVTNGLFRAEFVVTCRTTGATGTVISAVWMVANNVTASAVDTTTHTVDTTAAENITVTVQWSAASASDTLTLTQGSLQLIN